MTPIRLSADRSAIILAEICDLARGKLTRRANHFGFSEIVSSRELRIFRFRCRANQGHISCHPVPRRGASAIVTNVGQGAVDADAPLTNGADAYGEVVWS
jgi:hypothetical protein